MDQVVAAFKTALRHLLPFTIVHMVTRSLVLLVIVPASGLILALALSLAGRPAMTDQDIALFLLSPAGAVAALAVAGMLFLAVILDVAMMTLFLRRGPRPVLRALADDLRTLIGRVRALFGFGVLLFLRVLGLVAPFAVAGGAVALVLLGAYDINFYLTYWPVEFVVTVAVGGVLALGLGGVLLWKLSGWAIALHLVLLDRRRPAESFAASTALLRGHRRRIVIGIAIWVLARTALFGAFAFVAGVLIAGLQEVFLPALRPVILATLAGLALWALGNAILSGWCNGALAALLDAIHRAEAGTATPADPAPSQGPATARLPRPALVAVAVAALVIGAVGVGSWVARLPSIQTEARNVEVIAHRGAAALRPENTLSAVEKALTDKADWVEIDVQETADGEVIVAHDSDFMKLAGVDLKVWDATTEDLTGIDIGSWFDPAYADQRTPTLREVLQTAKGRGRVLIELKYYGHDIALEERVAQIVEEAGMASDVMLMSLKVEGVRKMRGLRPDWPTGVLAARAIGDLSGLDAQFVAVNTGQVSMRLVRQAHAAGKKVYVWTVDDPMTMSRMVSMGADGLITNDPALARRVMAQRAALTRAERILLWLSDRFRLQNFELVAEEGDA